VKYVLELLVKLLAGWDGKEGEGEDCPRREEREVRGVLESCSLSLTRSTLSRS
jgi:hypothetical protein